MPLPHILYPPPGAEGLRSWIFWHDQHHLEIIEAFEKQLGIQLQRYIIDPMPLKDFRAWLVRHQYAHNDMNGLLQIQGSDLQGLDLKSPEVIRQWMWTQFQEHVAVAQVLGL